LDRSGYSLVAGCWAESAGTLPLLSATRFRWASARPSRA